MKRQQLLHLQGFEKISSIITTTISRPGAALGIAVILVLAVIGPMIQFSGTWQLVTHTNTTIITFIMVTIQLKLNELIAANEKVSNRLVNIEGLTEDQLLILKAFYEKFSELSAKEKDLFSFHSIDEAQDIHYFKSKLPKPKITKDDNTA